MFVQGNALAATIHGTVYEWYSFKPLENTIVEINSTPEQSFVAKDADYSFNLTPGTYKITANYFEENVVVYESEEVVTISDDGEYIHDLLLFPAYQEDLLEQENLENVDLNFEKEETQSQANSQSTILIFALFALFILILAGYLVKKEKRNSSGKVAGPSGETQNLNTFNSVASEPNISEAEYLTIKAKMSEDTDAVTGSVVEAAGTDYKPPASYILGGDISEAEIPVQQGVKLPEDSYISVNSMSEEMPDSLSSESPESPELSLPDDLKEIMDLIRANGNRITQRELRKKSPYSESKVSLMLSDLEERGLVEKFKRGRGNIIRIPDEEALKLSGFQERKG